jgi:hypothetical protein
MFESKNDTRLRTSQSTRKDDERSKREDSQNIDEWLRSPDSKEEIVELGTCSGIRFMTSEGEKRMEPGKRYDQNLNEL